MDLEQLGYFLYMEQCEKEKKERQQAELLKVNADFQVIWWQNRPRKAKMRSKTRKIPKYPAPYEAAGQPQKPL